MRKTWPYSTILSLALLALCFVSCETKQSTHDFSPISNNKTLNLNFHDNVIRLNPLRAKNDAEKFIAALVFDRLFESNQNSMIVSKYTYDTLADTHYFDLYPKKQFHDGTRIDTKSIKTFFKYLIAHHLNEEPVSAFFTSMEGYPSINWYRKNRGIVDSLPQGFQIISDSKFSIKLNTRHQEILTWLQSPLFTLFKQAKGEYIGTGAYLLTSMNEDISAQLNKTAFAESPIETINISFTKNDDLVYAEFFRGSLDLITYQPLHKTPSPQTNKMNHIINTKYPEYQVTTSKRVIIRYAQLNNIQDSLLIKKVLHCLPKEKGQFIHLGSNVSIESYNLDSLKTESKNDTTLFKIKWYTKISGKQKPYLSNSKNINFSQTNPENIDPTQPHIVLKEISLDLLDSNDESKTLQTLVENLKNRELAKYIILDRFPEYVIYSNTLSGIKENSSLNESVKFMYFDSPQTY
ncbi:hypothetical protein N7E81_04875 [Reichenbachiella carrageenanivorans]|uniref:Solute-binding protein family 5 domain-containing protein n=1 Tax=Reichenbachiella carrageenanivorans TaxID=2979869 RepID=A0ABY6D2Q1_9BACT|nr:ABC transporter substrate-binding protein [Reichenbachiella carrageenanivorans]UXX80432.1 hypothetical protein N7E81_04875 [Reichenbachiella carrageenanivorans]